MPAVGAAVRVWWPEDGCWREGRVLELRAAEGSPAGGVPDADATKLERPGTGGSRPDSSGGDPNQEKAATREPDSGNGDLATRASADVQLLVGWDGTQPCAH